MGGRAIAAIALVAVALAVAGFLGGCGSGSEPGGAIGFGSAAVPKPPAPPPRVQRYDVGGRPDSVAAGAGYAWVADSQGASLQRINPGSKRPIAVETAGFATDVSADAGAAWLALADRGAIQRVTGTEGAARPVRVSGFPFRIAAGEGSVWAMSQTSIERIDPVSGEVAQPVELGGDLASIAAGEGAIWVVRGGDEVARLDPGTGEETAAADVPGAFSVATGESAAWALGGAPGTGRATLTRVDPSGSVDGIPVPVPDAVDVAAGLGFVWVLAEGGRLRLHDPETGLVAGGSIAVGKQPLSVTVGEGSVWVAASGSVYRVTP